MFNALDQLQNYWGDIASVLCGLSWAIAVIFYQKAGFVMGSLSMNIFKNMVGFAFILISLLFIGEPLLPEITADQWQVIAVSAFLGVTLADVFLVSALRRIGASLQAVVDCAYSPVIMVIAYIMYSEVLSTSDLFGGALVISAVWVGSKIKPAAHLVPGVGLGILLGATTHALNGYSVLIVKPLFSQLSILWIIGARFFIGQVFLIAGALLLGKSQEISAAFRWHRGHLTTIAATFFGNYLALILWMVGFKYTLAGRSAIYSQLSTVFIIILAAVFLNEKLTGRRLISVALGVGGALVVAFV